MVRLNVELGSATSKHGADLLEAIEFLMMATRLEIGCVECSVWQDGASTIHYTEVWTSEVTMRHRVLSEPFTLLLNVVDSARRASVQFDFVTVTRGLDYVAEVRGEAAPESGPERR